MHWAGNGDDAAYQMQRRFPQQRQTGNGADWPDARAALRHDPPTRQAVFQDLRRKWWRWGVDRRFSGGRPSQPDYALTLGGIVKAIQGVEKRLTVIEGHPAIRLKPFTWTADPDKIIAAVKRWHHLGSIH